MTAETERLAVYLQILSQPDEPSLKGRGCKPVSEAIPAKRDLTFATAASTYLAEHRGWFAEAKTATKRITAARQRRFRVVTA